MRNKKIVKLVISYCDEFTFDSTSEAMLFLQLWKKGKGDSTVKATIELTEVPTEAEKPVEVPVDIDPEPEYDRHD